ncbi:hypothetical protein A3K34_04290 [candidate division WWE3 bacterium RIFOXYC1_FULL_40_10]|uniref:Uncharacterized protein n=1 Tax=candidate division WWE3 bacterium RIFOXYA2_FULL_46_9 TaxID=1802636 RepID=A0A1F4W0Y4_UNCKA|nr:MAG: hypothetical protein A3K58_04290 [candidate division WWE3 bacterium RIFOXYB1_FULL_40_22]OGC62061.1 MAG: hypothetical protein A3K37_04290 [candidate division WWE3 bacterium RIFOXYA1_FULL_40_11]OGC63076.1 MAG: hypothetical protein A2264_00035 [candidate division WWE3 bacterium RIFOXYA2_FULL_46_9]OGC64994.1 MAG: hypothetical protein A2326_03075 [candidate division WWE3 bacterium RIFOXYB2_FULL_41_6]OGC66444.1 MAG: hypothetical protein A3K34_04290 [candidate division WWE3 bacterium RIFOXYC1_
MPTTQKCHLMFVNFQNQTQKVGPELVVELSNLVDKVLTPGFEKKVRTMIRSALKSAHNYGAHGVVCLLSVNRYPPKKLFEVNLAQWHYNQDKFQDRGWNHDEFMAEILRNACSEMLQALAHLATFPNSE